MVARPLSPDAERDIAGIAGYIYNLNTKGLTAGTHTMTFMATGDPIPHTVSFVLR